MMIPQASWTSVEAAINKNARLMGLVWISLREGEPPAWNWSLNKFHNHNASLVSSRESRSSHLPEETSLKSPYSITLWIALCAAINLPWSKKQMEFSK
jgi:hypothetical protein